MIDLFIDVGNSRIKLALLDNDNYEYLGAFPVDNLMSDKISTEFFSQLDFKPDHIYISSVTDASIEMLLRDLIAESWQLLPIFMSTQSYCCGIHNGYSKAHQLGVDRWMALMGARAQTSGSFIVIDAGTAITVDMVLDCEHKGGLIVPGIQTMRSSLMKETANLDQTCHEPIASSDDDESSNSLAIDTQSAICGGTLYMAAAFVNNVIFDIQSQYINHFDIYITGGDGQLLSSLINTRNEYIEDLVLLGMINIKENIKNS
ncbi:MAG: type III pantothenate kinase [Pseudomonadota bacterium]|nr:type III pantothenate kinase [Pseudomonadota bacterium]